jgi:hypothetical protein
VVIELSLSHGKRVSWRWRSSVGLQQHTTTRTTLLELSMLDLGRRMLRCDDQDREFAGLSLRVSYVTALVFGGAQAWRPMGWAGWR